MLNKKIIAALLIFSSSTLFAANIIGIGQVGDKFIYKIGGVLVSLSAGNVVDGCVVRGSSGLQCDDNFDRVAGKKTALVTLQDTVIQFKAIEELSKNNASMENKITDLSLEINVTKSKLQALKKSYIAKINSRNKSINRLSMELNSRK